MAYQEISTGYKPEFALGALYHGFNAGSADNASQLSNLIQEQALQKSRIGDPLDLIQKFYDSQLANAKMNSPDYIPAQLRGQIGQMNLQDVAGRKAVNLEADDTAAQRQELKNKLLTGQIDARMYQEQSRMFDDIQSGKVSEQPGQIGFPMQEYQSPRNENYGNEGRQIPILKNEATMKTSMGTDYRSGDKPYDLETIDKEIRLHGDKTGELAKERARLVASLAQGGSVPESSSVSGNVFQQFGSSNKETPYSNLIPTQSVLAKMAGVRALDPKFVGDMAKIESKGEDAKDIAAMRLAQQERLAGLKQRAIQGDKTAQQALVGYWQGQLASGAIDQQTYTNEMAQIFNRATAPKIQPGTMLNSEVAPDVLQQKPETPAYVPNSAKQSQQPKSSLEDAIAAELARRQNKGK